MGRKTRREHDRAIVISGESEPVIVRQQGDVVGAFTDPVFGVTELTLNPKDRFFLYSDGLIETGGTHEAVIGRLAGLCGAQRKQSLKNLVPSVMDEINSYRTVQDDTILMGVEV